MSNTGKWWIGIIVLAIVALLLSLIGPFSATKNSKEMGASIQNALNVNHGWAKVDMSGNVAKISGEAKSEASRDSALSVAQNAKCEKCKGNKERTWHVAKDDGITIAKAPIVSPYVFTASKSESGRVILDGYVRNEEERLSVLAEAKKLFPGKVTNKTLKIASGEPSEKWREIISHNLIDLSKLETGKAAMSDKTTVLTGRAASADIRNEVMADYSSLPAPFEGVPNVQSPDGAAMEVKEVNSQELCQILFDQLKGDNKINFAYDKAEIRGAESFQLLDTLASAAKQCASFRVSVEGHTDWDGSDNYNNWLSDARAKTVVAYLADNGVDTSRLTAKGFGESKPVASNETPEGMAKNRRIEFKVTRSN